MAAQSCHQPGAESGDIAVPGALRCVMVALAALVVVLAALPVLMALDPASTVESIARNDPSLGPAELDFALTAAIAYAAILHVIYAAVAVWFGVVSLRGRRWARIALTVLMVAATLNSVDSALKGPEYLWWAIGGDVIHIVVVGLLWIPAPVRGFFAAHRSRAVAS
jgi:hypothetical protein